MHRNVRLVPNAASNSARMHSKNFLTSIVAAPYHIFAKPQTESKVLFGIHKIVVN